MDIKSKLRLIDSTTNKQKLSDINHTNKYTETIDKARIGNVVKNDFGAYSQIVKNYPPEYVQGDILLSSFKKKSASSLALLDNNSKLTDIDLSRTLFLDTETTGLSGGVGTCAFLIGVGFFKNDEFHLIQFFMNDFNEESPLLHDLSELVKNFDLLITYNGKSYDIPLMNSRYIYNNIQTPFVKILHVDLLHIVRRLWNHRMPECSLTSAESHITNVSRTGDVPGYMIPYLFFNYLTNNNVEPLKPVLYHNQEDILSMVALLTKALEFMEAPLEQCKHPTDILRIGQIIENVSNFDRANELYIEYLQTHPENIKRRDILIKIAFNYKKLEKWSEAESKWLECIKNENFHPLPYIEIAKHYEHRNGNISKAQYYVEKALSSFNLLESLNRNGKWMDYKEDLLYRLERLNRKLKN